MAAAVPDVTPHVKNAAIAVIGLGLIVLVFALIAFIAGSVASASNQTGVVSILDQFRPYLSTIGLFLMIFAIVTMAIGIVSYLMSTFGLSIRLGG